MIRDYSSLQGNFHVKNQNKSNDETKEIDRYNDSVASNLKALAKFQHCINLQSIQHIDTSKAKKT